MEEKQILKEVHDEVCILSMRDSDFFIPTQLYCFTPTYCWNVHFYEFELMFFVFNY